MRFGIRLGASIAHMSINLSPKPGAFCIDAATQKISAGSAGFNNKPWHHRVLLLRNNPIVWDNLSPSIIVLAYTLAVYFVHAILGIQDKLILRFFSESFTCMAVIFTALYFLFHIMNHSYRRFFSRRYVIGFLTIFALMPLFKAPLQATSSQSFHPWLQLGLFSYAIGLYFAFRKSSVEAFGADGEFPDDYSSH